MEVFGKVKRMYTRDKKSLREIAKSTGLSRNTVRKWVLETKQAGREPEYGRKEMPSKLIHQRLQLYATDLSSIELLTATPEFPALERGQFVGEFVDLGLAVQDIAVFATMATACCRLC